MSTIEIENVGPITRLILPAPEDGGVVELRGANGIGKSHAIRAIQSALSGEPKDLSVRRGSPRGSVSAFGVTLRLGKRSTKAGELEVESIESELDLSKLVDPGIQDETKADARRLKEIVGLVDLEPAALVEKLKALLPEGADADEVLSGLFNGDALVSDDLLVLAEKFKRACDTAALKRERAAEEYGSTARVLFERIQGIDLTAESDPARLQAAHTEAVQRLAELRTQAEAAERSAKAEQQAREALAEASGKNLPTVADAQKAWDTAADFHRLAHDEVEAAQAALDKAKANRQRASDAVNDAQNMLEQARQRDEEVQRWQRQTAVERVAPPDPVEVEAAAQEVKRTQDAIHCGQRVRDAKNDDLKAQGARAAAKAQLTKAGLLREAAKGVDGVLSDIVGASGLAVQVQGDRLYHDGTLFSELSHGQRWRAVLSMAAKCSKRGGVFGIPQEAWEAMQPRVRREVVAAAREHGVTIYAARATDDENIVAEVL